MKKIANSRIVIIFALIIIAMLIRLLPHPNNFTPIAAIALFSGALLGRKWYAFVVPMVIMLLSDIVIGFHSTMWAVYLSFALVVALGMFLCKNMRFANVFLTALLSAVLFFLITNFACYLHGWYGYTLSGLATCYQMAIPFFRMELLSTMVYSLAFWGVYTLVHKKVWAVR
ncbi:MAG: DUF6580 family putative transport protein [Bacteroidales bacterium]|jgi:hypothetical protein|nr:hypothetical protein [Bacteroidales bacterium]MDD2687659.1 hypothetical protein [Bacteroidales bacterium]MDD3330629.1 hypothetical protein [Bacteroidales bacterium]MDD3691476.1 hypothetical protein [Bacteroidales bacterium]MDD4044588.1 hypothetical protein [Bacteroidales bacterium]